jgi:GNAT superfamily N-acetyltransferase
MIVRQMRPDEIDVTVTLFRYYAAEAAAANSRFGEEFDVNSVIKTIRSRTIQPTQVWLNMYDGSRPVGFITGSVAQCPWNHEIFYGHAEMFYILESHRNMNTFKQLVNSFEEWAKQFNAQHISASDMGINPDRTQKVFSHLGFRNGVFLYRECE